MRVTNMSSVVFGKREETTFAEDVNQLTETRTKGRAENCV